MNASGSGFQGGFLARPMGIAGIIVLALYMLLVAVLGVYVLVGIWPLGGEAPATSLFWGVLTVSVPEDLELRLIAIAATAGALGSFIHIATSYATYIGNRRLIRSWAVWYLARPFIGMVLAVLVYLLLRGGLLAPSASTGDMNPYGVAGICGLTGMFAKQAADKLREVFDNIFTAKGDAEREDKTQ
jgi:hypothetical protein